MWVSRTLALGWALTSSITHAEPATERGGSGAAGPMRNDPVRVTVRATPHLEARASYEDGRLVVSGRVVEDTNAPLRSDALKLTLSQAPRGVAADAAADAGDNAAGAPEARSLEGRVEPCSGMRTSPPRGEAGGRAILATNELGAFCVRLVVDAVPLRVDLSLPEGELYTAASASVVYNGSLHAVALDFEPPPHRVSLDAPSLVVDVAAHFEGRGGTAAAPGLPLTLVDERGEELAQASTNGLGRATFTVPTARLAGPGPGELKVSFAGSATASPTTLRAAVEREAHVALEVPAAEGGKLPPAYPDDGVPIVVDVTTVRGPVTGGVVQALVGPQVVGAAPVENGRAEVVAVFTTPRASMADVRLHYAADAPWHVPGRDRIVTLPVLRESPWRNVPVALAGVALLAWMVVGRTRRKTELRTARHALPTVPPPHADVEVLRPAKSRHEGWHGIVRDAHDGEIVPGAIVRIERPGFTASETLVASVAEADGTFALPHVAVRPGDELVAEARLHAVVRKPVPSGGELRISLVLRRRALLDRLVRWARRRGIAAEAQREPTPEDIRSVSADEAVIPWADAVERAAFSGVEVDEATEAAVDALAPREAPAPASARPKR